jgi:hypothetical protein
MRRFELLFVASAACASTDRENDATTPAISTNRPSFSDSASLSPAGRVQVETGYTFSNRSQGGSNTERQTVPEVLVRYRPWERLEAQLLWSGRAWQSTTAAGARSTEEAFTDLGVGMRMPIAEQDGWLPQLALGGLATLGTGQGSLSSGRHTIPTGKLLWAYALAPGVGLGGNLIAAYPWDGERRFGQFAASAFVTVALDGRTTLFVENFVVAPWADGAGSAHTIDGGALFLLRSDLQLDARVGFGLNDGADDFFGGIGISFLL